MAKRKAKTVTDDADPEYGPQDLGSMAERREEIAKRARAKRKPLGEEVDVDDDSLAVLHDADSQIIGAGKASGDADVDAGEDQNPDSDGRGTKAGDEGIASERVDVVIYGKTYSVPRKDVERAGGIDAYQVDRAARMRMSEASATLQRAQRREQEIRNREEDLERREKQLNERSSRTQESEQGSEPPSEGAQRSESDHRQKVKSIVDRIFSGRVDDAELAIEEILAETSKAVDEDAIVAKAVRKLQEQEQAQQQAERTRQEEERRSRERQDRATVNRVMREEFPDILQDSLKLKVARAYFLEMRSDPKNLDRDIADIARSAGEAARNIRIDDPEAERRIREDEKRDMPSETSARQRKAPEDDKPRIASASQHIKRMRQARGLAQ